MPDASTAFTTETAGAGIRAFAAPRRDKTLRLLAFKLAPQASSLRGFFAPDRAALAMPIEVVPIGWTGIGLT
jgi:hypothetical protein